MKRNTKTPHSQEACVQNEPTVLCRCCATAMQAVLQQFPTLGKSYWLLTCTMPGCPMEGQTISDQDYPTLNLRKYGERAAKLEVIRAMDAVDNSLRDATKYAAAIVALDRLSALYGSPFICECRILYMAAFPDGDTQPTEVWA